MSRVVIEGRCFHLCRSHVEVVVASMPATFADLQALFVGFFPPRPEEQRRSFFGRRASDPMD